MEENSYMDEKEKLRELIDNPKMPTVSEWVYEVEAFLDEVRENDTEAWTLIDGIKLQGDKFNRCENLTALLRQLYKRKYDKVAAKPPKKSNQIFVAMMFSDEMDDFYDQAYKPVAEDMGYTTMRIDRKDYTGLIIEEIESEIKNSIAVIADLTGNRGGVYYEAGIARGLQLCNHPLKLILTCQKDFFDKESVHFDLRGNNIVLYQDIKDLKEKLSDKLKNILTKQ
jgi:hypothetical protein